MTLIIRRSRSRRITDANIGGNRLNQWYGFPKFASFHLERAHVNGNNKAACDTGNGATSCLIGVFNDSSPLGPSVRASVAEAPPAASRAYS